jgi:uncharacterized membrane protein YfcA
VSVVDLIILLCGGGAAGFLAGFFGVGGGIILVPLLLLFYQGSGVSSLVATHLAFGTSLLIIVFASGSSALRYSRNRLVAWKAVAYLGAGSVLGGLGGSVIAGGMDGRTLRQIFAVIMLLSAIQLIGKIKKGKNDQTPDAFPPALMLSGVFVGLVSSLAGVGGGVLAIPILHSVFRFPFKKALGTSSATIVVTALAAGLGYVIQGWGNPSLPPSTFGFVDFLHAAPMIIGSIPLAVVGANVAHGTDPRRLTGIFAVLLVVVALRLLFF